jgi:hypothetical protein
MGKLDDPIWVFHLRFSSWGWGGELRSLALPPTTVYRSPQVKLDVLHRMDITCKTQWVLQTIRGDTIGFLCIASFPLQHAHSFTWLLENISRTIAWKYLDSMKTLKDQDKVLVLKVIAVVSIIYIEASHCVLVLINVRLRKSINSSIILPKVGQFATLSAAIFETQ